MDGFQFRIDWEFWRAQPNTLANRIKFLRLKEGYSISAAARKGEIRKATWIETESGKRTPRKRTLLLMGAVLGMSPSRIAAGDLADWVELLRCNYDLQPDPELTR